MPLLLSEEMEERWLSSNTTIEKQIEEVLNSTNEIALKAHTVGKLRGKNYVGNTESIYEEVEYAELDPEKLNL